MQAIFYWLEDYLDARAANAKWRIMRWACRHLSGLSGAMGDAFSVGKPSSHLTDTLPKAR
jgi:hypothetical protein